MNDPNGFSYFKGEYHLFYQYYPYNPYWGDMHWGHAKSKDLMSWEHLPIALRPDMEFDQDGCFSGSAVEDDGKLHIFYTAIRYSKSSISQSGNKIPADEKSLISTQAYAFTEDGIHFKKKKEPIIACPKEVGDEAYFRDPKVWKKDQYWYMVVGSKSLDKEQGNILVYKSSNLVDWQYLSSITKGDIGRMWECPDLFELEGKDIFLFSPIDGGEDEQKNIACYYTGSFNYEKGDFKFEDFDMLDYGFEYYAPQSMLDSKNRRILVGWLVMEEPLDANENWTGMMTLPRVLSLRNGRLQFDVVDEIKSYRRESLQKKDVVVNKQYELNFQHENTFEMNLEVEIKDNFELQLFSDEKKGLKLSYNSKNRQVVINREDVMNDSKAMVFGKERKSPQLLVNNNLKLRIFADKSVVEVFINDGQYVMSAIVNPREEQKKIIVKGNSPLKNIEIWRLEKIF